MEAQRQPFRLGGRLKDRCGWVPPEMHAGPQVQVFRARSKLGPSARVMTTSSRSGIGTFPINGACYWALFQHQSLFFAGHHPQDSCPSRQNVVRISGLQWESPGLSGVPRTSQFSIRASALIKNQHDLDPKYQYGVCHNQTMEPERSVLTVRSMYITVDNIFACHCISVGRISSDPWKLARNYAI